MTPLPRQKSLAPKKELQEDREMGAEQEGPGELGVLLKELSAKAQSLSSQPFDETKEDKPLLREVEQALSAVMSYLNSSGEHATEEELRACAGLSDIAYKTYVDCYYPPAGLAETQWLDHSFSLESVRAKARSLLKKG